MFARAAARNDVSGGFVNFAAREVVLKEASINAAAMTSGEKRYLRNFSAGLKKSPEREMFAARPNAFSVSQPSENEGKSENAVSAPVILPPELFISSLKAVLINFNASTGSGRLSAAIGMTWGNDHAP